jgi:RNA polymerase sigma-70 factor (ECF subfamily)
VIDRLATSPAVHWAGLSDIELLAHASGDEPRPDAFRELYRRYHRPLFTFLLRRLPDRQVAEEALQETFVKLWRQAARHDPQRGSVAALLFTVGRSVAVDVQRREARHVRDGVDVADVTVAAPIAAPGAELSTVVAGCIGRLPAPQRELLDLAYWGDLTQRQIAEVLRIPVGTVKSRLFHALRALRGELQLVGVMQ